MKFNISLLVILALVFFSNTAPIYSQDANLAGLRKDFALRYLQPDAHFALAKYYLDQGNFVQAFSILEYARRYRFEEEEFDKSYFAFFGDPMPEPPDEAKDLFKTASDLVTQQKYDEAEIYFRKAYARYDKSFFINVWIGRFYYKAKSDATKALPFYFQAYFLYPHAYETEYAESRIRTISLVDAQDSFNNSLKNGRSLPDLARDQNPIVVGKAIEAMAKNWKPEYLNVMLEVMSNDDSIDRWGAFVTLQRNAGPSLDKTIDELLTDNDLRKRGLAAYSVIERKGEKKFQILKKMLTEQSELVRFDAVSALMMRGGATGKQILVQHQRVEKQPRLKALIATALKEDKK